MKKNRLLWFAVEVIAVLLWFAFGKSSQKSKVYTGVVVNKFHTTGWRLKGRRVKTLYYIVVRTDKKENIKVEVPRSLYDRFEIGTSVIKRKGFLYPEPVNPGGN